MWEQSPARTSYSACDFVQLPVAAVVTTSRMLVKLSKHATQLCISEARVSSASSCCISWKDVYCLCLFGRGRFPSMLACGSHIGAPKDGAKLLCCYRVCLFCTFQRVYLHTIACLRVCTQCRAAVGGVVGTPCRSAVSDSTFDLCFHAWKVRYWASWLSGS